MANHREWWDNARSRWVCSTCLEPLDDATPEECAGRRFTGDTPINAAGSVENLKREDE